jgi:hypothetical protein
MKLLKCDEFLEKRERKVSKLNFEYFLLVSVLLRYTSFVDAVN